MTWTITVDTGVSSDSSTDFFNLKERLVTVGFRVLGSGDGLALYELQSASTSGNGTGSGGVYDVWSTAAKAGNQAVGAGSWVKLGTPLDAVSHYEMVFYLDPVAGPTLANWRVEMAYGATGGFTGGSPTFGVPPTSSTGVAPGMPRPGTRPAAAVLGSGTWAPDTAGKTIMWIGDLSESYDWLMLRYRSDSVVFSALGEVYLDQPARTDVDPFVHIREARDAVTDAANIFGIEQGQAALSDTSATETSEEDDSTRAVTNPGWFCSYEHNQASDLTGTYRAGMLTLAQYNPAGTLVPAHKLDNDYETGDNFSFGQLSYGKLHGRWAFLKGCSSSDLVRIGTLTAEVATAAAQWKVVKDSADNYRYTFDGVSLPWHNTAFEAF